MFMSSSGGLHNLWNVNVPYCYLTFLELLVNFANTLQLSLLLPPDLSSIPVIFEMGH